MDCQVEENKGTGVFHLGAEHDQIDSDRVIMFLYTLLSETPTTAEDVIKALSVAKCVGEDSTTEVTDMNTWALNVARVMTSYLVQK
jgi:hypothetical protein